jgi:hypothetical protein
MPEMENRYPQITKEKYSVECVPRWKGRSIVLSIEREHFLTWHFHWQTSRSLAAEVFEIHPLLG